MIYQGNMVSITHEGLDENLFNHSPIWCEYNLPAEIDLLVERGEDRLFLQEHLISDAYSSAKSKTYYSLPSDMLHPCDPLPIFLHIASKVIVHGVEYAGYLWIVEGQITGVTVFDRGRQIDLSLNEELDDENRLALSKLSYKNIRGMMKIRITPSSKTLMLDNDRELRIPV